MSEMGAEEQMAAIKGADRLHNDNLDMLFGTKADGTPITDIKTVDSGVLAVYVERAMESRLELASAGGKELTDGQKGELEDAKTAATQVVESGTTDDTGKNLLRAAVSDLMGDQIQRNIKESQVDNPDVFKINASNDILQKTTPEVIINKMISDQGK